MTGRTKRGAVALAIVALAATALASTAAARVDTSAAKTVNVAFLYPKTGGLSQFGGEEYYGFQAGLAYTKGKCGGYTINPTYIDDATDPATAINAFKSEVGQGVKIIAGTGSSGIALQLGPLAAQNDVLYISGAAANDGITGLNKNTFRAGRQTFQDVYDAAGYFPPKSAGKKVVVFAEDTAFGAGNYAAVNLVFGGKGHTVSKILVPFGAADLTPYAQQLKNSGADLVFIAWAGTNGPAMWQALQQQGVAKSMGIITGLANRETYNVIGPLVPGVTLVSHYVYQAPKNAANTYLVKWYKNNLHDYPNLFSPDGFVTAQMICRAISKGSPTDVSKMITALEGWKFLAPKGNQYIRPQDHAMLQPMFQVQLNLNNATGNYVAKVVKTVAAGLVAPPITPFK